MKPLVQVPLRAHNTLGVRSTAEYAIAADSDQSIVQAAQWALERELPFTLLGGGSNVILAPDIPGLVTLVRNRGIRCEARDRSVIVTAKAGENWHDLVRFSLGKGLYGLQAMALIPGSVGAAPVQNIGAYGSELADCFDSLVAYDREQRATVRLDGADCAFSYRDSIFKREGRNRFVILEISLRLSPVQPLPDRDTLYSDVDEELTAMGITVPTAVQIAEAVCRIRRRKLPDPRKIGNVGSVFKNPIVSESQARSILSRVPDLTRYAHPSGVRLSAAQLIDRAGCKALKVESAYVWFRQPLVLVQTQKQRPPTAEAFCQLLEQVRAAVAQQFGVELEAEPQRLGWSD